MRRIGRIVWGAAFALFLAAAAPAEEMDIQALQARLEAQEARLNDLSAKLAQRGMPAGAASEAPEAVTSMRKNASVTIGGTLNTRYFHHQGRLKSRLVPSDVGGVPVYADAGARMKREDYKLGNLHIADAKVFVTVDVNEYFDAFIQLDLQDGESRANVSGIAQNYWVRWKNICNSGFGLLVGRDALKFGDAQPIGALDSWNKDSGSSIGNITGGSRYPNHDGTFGNGMFANGSMLPAHTTYNWTRTTQINPYWESADKSFRLDLSLIQSIDRLTGGAYGRERGERTKYRSINDGFGSATARIQWKPIEGLQLTASAMNLYNKRPGSTMAWSVSGLGGEAVRDYGVPTAANNTSVNFAVRYRPAAFSRLNVWAQWTHGWNEAWVKDQDSDSANFGFSYDLTEALTLFAQGDYLRVKNANSDLWHRAGGWAAYAGFVYTLPYGVNFEMGWRHEWLKYKGRYLGTHTKLSADTVYAHLGFNF